MADSIPYIADTVFASTVTTATSVSVSVAGLDVQPGDRILLTCTARSGSGFFPTPTSTLGYTTLATGGSNVYDTAIYIGELDIETDADAAAFLADNGGSQQCAITGQGGAASAEMIIRVHVIRDADLSTGSLSTGYYTDVPPLTTTEEEIPGVAVTSANWMAMVVYGSRRGTATYTLGASADAAWADMTPTVQTSGPNNNDLQDWYSTADVLAAGDTPDFFYEIDTANVGYAATIIAMKGAAPPPVPVARFGSGIFAEAIIAGKHGEGVWLLDVDTGGEILRFANRPVSVESRDLGSHVLYEGGLSDFDSPVSIDSASLQLGAPTRQAWDAFRNQLGPLRGRRARLRRWYEGLYLEDAYLLLDGTVEGAAWGDPSAGDSLAITIGRSAEALALTWPRPTAIYDTDNFTQNAGVTIDEGLVGQNYPTVIGAPGDAGTGRGDPFLGSPAGIVSRLTLNRWILIAGHHVAATSVKVWNNSQNDFIAQATVVNSYDLNGHPVALVDTAAETWSGGTVINREDELFVGWSREWGVGLTHRGRPVTGLGDLLIWGVETLSRAHWDRAEMEAQRASLNRIRIDTYWNEGMTWESWVQANVMGAYPVVEVQGPGGRYYRLIEFETDERKVQMRLATAGNAGRRVERLTPLTEFDGDIYNTIEVDYGARPTTDVARRKLVVGPTKGVIPGPPGGAQITTTASDFRAATSVGYYGPRYRYLELPTTWDSSTAALVARWTLADHALPGRRARYLGGDELLALYEYAHVRVIDSSFGVDIDAIGLVEDLVITSAGVEIQVYWPEDPLASTP